MNMATRILPLKTFLQDYGWIHLGLGLIGNATFFVGSLLFLPALEAYKTIGVWLFIVGSLLMLVGSVGQFLVDLFKRQDKRQEEKRRTEWNHGRQTQKAPTVTAGAS